MVHAIHRVTAFAIVGPYTVDVTFDDGTQQIIDFEPVLRGVLFGPLQDQGLFNAVRLDAGGGHTRVAERSRLRSGDSARLAAGRPGAGLPRGQMGSSGRTAG